MPNQYTIMRFGSTFEFVEMQLRKDGFEMMFACTYDGNEPPDLPRQGGEDGWTMRRMLKEWCKKHDVPNYKIVRNRGYVFDLRGIVYELWIHRDNSEAEGKENG